MRQSQAFAAYRAEQLIALTDDFNKAVPHFNAEAEDIRKEHENTRAESEALADHRRRARIADMVVRRKEFLDSLTTALHTRLDERVIEYGGEKKQVEEKGKTVTKVFFPDKSEAKYPSAFWADYRAFTRV